MVPVSCYSSELRAFAAMTSTSPGIIPFIPYAPAATALPREPAATGGDGVVFPAKTSASGSDTSHFGRRMSHFRSRMSHFESDSCYFQSDSSKFWSDSCHFRRRTSYFESNRTSFWTWTSHFWSESSHFQMHSCHSRSNRTRSGRRTVANVMSPPNQRIPGAPRGFERSDLPAWTGRRDGIRSYPSEIRGSIQTTSVPIPSELRNSSCPPLRSARRVAW
jgi:hypothetical protein